MRQFDANKIYRNNCIIALSGTQSIPAGTIQSGEQWEKMVPHEFTVYDVMFDILDDEYEYITDDQVRVCIMELDTMINRWCNNNVSRKEILPHINDHITKEK